MKLIHTAMSPTAAPVCNDSYDLLGPRWLLTPEQYLTAKSNLARLVRVGLEIANIEFQIEPDAPERTSPEMANLQAEAEKLQTALQTLIAQVLQGQLGLEPFMVIHFKGEAMPEYDLVDNCAFQLLGGELNTLGEEDGEGYLVWRLFGNRLRKDGSIGVKTIEVLLDKAHLHRRLIGGDWQRLRQGRTG